MPFDTYFNLEQEKQERIMNAAKSEFANKGYHKTSIQDISKKADISKGSMYQYFRNKQELFVYIIKQGLDLKFHHMYKVIEDYKGSSFYNLLEELLKVGIQIGRDNPDLYKISQFMNNNLPAGVTEELSKIINVEAMIKYRQFMNDLLQKAIAIGEVRKDLDVDMIFFLIDSIIRIFGEYIKDDLYNMKDEDIQNYIKQVISILKDGIELK